MDWEEDHGFTGTITSPELAVNPVLSVGTSSFASSDPGPSGFDVSSVTTCSKQFLDSLWIPSLPVETVTQLDSPPSFSRESRTFNASTGRLEQVRRHELSSGTSSGDVTDQDINYFTAGPFAYGKPKSVTVSRAGVVDDATGFRYIPADATTPYSGPYTFETWKLCSSPTVSRGGLTRDGSSTVDRCPGWSPAPSELGPVKAELTTRATIDPHWRRATGVRDGNGDGVSSISYDELGRLKALVPTDSSKAASGFSYSLDHRTVSATVSDPSATGGAVLVARTQLDGLGRPSHAARRLEDVSAANTYITSLFRHQFTRYDGAGTPWLQSHWLTSASVNPFDEPASQPEQFNHFGDWEVVAKVDQTGRVEHTMLSDGGDRWTSYKGPRYAVSTVLGSDAEALSRTVTEQDARGATIAVWEERRPSPRLTPPRYSRPRPPSGNLTRYIRPRPLTTSPGASPGSR